MQISNWKLSHWLFAGVMGFLGTFLMVYIWQYPNVFQIDFGGQIASSQFFISHGFHARTMNWFQGLINNLFYPPLQDFIVFIIHSLTGLETLYSFLIYTSFLILAYMFGYVLIASRLKTTQAVLVFGILSLAFLFMNKFPDISRLQGLTIVDFMFTGLITQFLGGVRLLFAIAEILGKGRLRLLGVYATLAMISHLVVGPVVVCLVVLHTLLYKKKYILHILGSIIGLTAFFILPFLVYKGDMASTNIVHELPRAIIFILIIILFFLPRKSSLSILLITGIAILLPTEIAHILKGLRITEFSLPSFHYYRFGSIALIIAIVGVGYIVDKLTEKITSKQQYWYSAFIFSMLGVLLFLLRGQRGGFWQPMTAVLGKNPPPTQQDLSLLSGLDTTKRIFTIDAQRPVDFAIDSLDQYRGYQNIFAKGLFWESSYTNQMVSSYIASLLSSQNAVLNTYNPGNVNYKAYANMWDNFVDIYGVGYLVVAPQNTRYYLDPLRRINLEQFLSGGTTNLAVSAKGTMPINNMEYTLYEITPRPGSIINNSVFSVAPSRSKPITIDPHHMFFTRPIIEDNVSPVTLATGYVPLMIQRKDAKEVVPITGVDSAELIVELLGQNRYGLQLSGASEGRIQVKIAPLPGWSLYDEQNNKIPMIDTPFARYAYITGPVQFVYERTWIMVLGYLISSITLLTIVVYIYRQRKEFRQKL